MWPAPGLRSKLAPPISRVLEAATGDADEVLDVGCGSDSPIGRFERRPRHAVGVDIFDASIEKSRAAGIHDEYVITDVLTIGRLFPSDSFDVCVAFDVIEHLEQQDAIKLLVAMERIARRRVVVLTPNGFLQQDEYDGNAWQRHRSGWSTSVLRDLGFRVYGLHGLRGLRGDRAQIDKRPVRMWEFVADVSQPIVYHFPRLAFHLLAVKLLSPQHRDHFEARSSLKTTAAR
jgi:SAM-dependent methyltransferase